MGLRFDSQGKEKIRVQQIRGRSFQAFPAWYQGGQATGVGVEGEGCFRVLRRKSAGIEGGSVEQCAKNAPFKQYDRVEYVTFKRDNKTVVRAIIYGDVNIIGLNEGDKEFGKKDGEN